MLEPDLYWEPGEQPYPQVRSPAELKGQVHKQECLAPSVEPHRQIISVMELGEIDPTNTQE